MNLCDLTDRPENGLLKEQIEMLKAENAMLKGMNDEYKEKAGGVAEKNELLCSEIQRLERENYTMRSQLEIVYMIFDRK